MMRFVAIVVMAASSSIASGIEDCPGEGRGYSDNKCNHDETHRVCAQLLGSDSQPLSWGPKGDFWEITGQKDFQWDDTIRANGGDSWCICMWATARLITAAGCENVHLHCEATDISYVLQSYTDGGVELEPAKQCLKEKCPEFVSEIDAMLPQIAGGLAGQSVAFNISAFFVMLLLSILAVSAFTARRLRSASPIDTDSNTDIEIDESLE